MKAYFYDLIKRPVITEKSTELGEKNKYTFEVDINANKADIRDAIENIFLVKVKSVNTSVVKGKKKRFKGIKGSQSNWKKAVVSLETGHSIELMGGDK